MALDLVKNVRICEVGMRDGLQNEKAIAFDENGVPMRDKAGNFVYKNAVDENGQPKLSKSGKPVMVVVNKIDKVHPDQLLAQIDDFRSQMEFKEIVPISALQGNNVSRLIDILSENLEEGFQYFPADQITDHPERFLVSEMIREKVLHLTREEIPHSVAVVVDSMKRDEETDKVHIRATIMVERDSQKGIVIGKGGAMLKKIGTLARKDIELMLGDKVFLETWVKVKKNWRDKKLDLADFGYNEKEY